MTKNMIEPVSGFETSKYLGKWYEIARLPNFFEKDLTDITAEYKFGEKGRIVVINSGYDMKKQQRENTLGYARFAGVQDVADLKIRFFWPFYAQYKIIALDKVSYSWALVCGSKFNYLWILSRTPQMDKQQLEQLIRFASDKGFNTGKLVFVDQSRNINS
ncbi:MAG: lipocalin family protein [Elusimicrobia bacterium]|nr:lipocalin family protein [Candidatus Liberimonas magnetica]